MTIQIPYRGIIEIVGDHDVGKTIAALQVTNNMKDVVFVDDDVKGEGTVRQMKEGGMEFDLYIDLASERLKLGNTPTADELLQKVVLPTIETIKAKKRKVIIWDTWRIVYQSARGHVERNQSRYSSVVNFRGNSQIIQGLISKVARMIEQKQLNELKACCDLLIITHHVKDRYEGGVVAGKIPESSATFSEVCNMRIWLRRNQQSKVPLILFLKRPNLPKIVSGKLRFTNIVPLKITPTDKHNSIWDAIAEYEAKPIESRAPNQNEMPTSEELAALTGTLTQEQQAYVKSMIDYQLKLEADLIEAQNDVETVSKSSQDASGRTETPIPSTYPVNGVQLLSLAKSELGLELSDIEAKLGMKFVQINETFKPEYWDKLQVKEKSDEQSKQKSKRK